MVLRVKRALPLLLLLLLCVSIYKRRMERGLVVFFMILLFKMISEE